VGTGLLYLSGQALAVAGPFPLFLSYLLMGTGVYSLQVYYISKDYQADNADHTGRNDFSFADSRSSFYVAVQVLGQGSRRL
jgi:hypothetical protein